VRKKSFPQRLVRLGCCCPQSSGCPIPAGAQGKPGWGHGQTELVHDLAAGNPARGWWLELDGL